MTSFCFFAISRTYAAHVCRAVGVNEQNDLTVTTRGSNHYPEKEEMER